MHALECWRDLDHQVFTEENCRLQSRTISRESLLVLQLEEAEEWDHPRLWSLDAGHRAIGVRICPTGFQSCFGPMFPCYASILPFWNRNVYSAALYTASL